MSRLKYRALRARTVCRCERRTSASMRKCMRPRYTPSPRGHWWSTSGNSMLSLWPRNGKLKRPQKMTVFIIGSNIFLLSAICCVLTLYAGQAEVEIEFRLLVFIATGCTLLLLTSVELCRKYWLERKMSVFFAFECNHNSFRVVPLFSISQNAQKCNIEHMDRSCKVRFQHKLNHVNKLY